MKPLIFVLASVAANASILFAQEVEKTEQPAVSNVSLLSKFVGKWSTTSQPLSDSEVAPAPYMGTMEARLLGRHWLICEYDADMGGTQFNAMQRLKFDAKENAYSGTWVDSFLDFEWPLTGQTDGKKLIVNSKGPDPTKPGATSSFRDIYEFKSDDLIVSTSEMESEDGTWTAFMSGEFRREETSMKTAGNKISRTTMMPFLMFEGQAEEAIKFYTSTFPNAKINDVAKYGAGEPGREGSIKQAKFELAGQKVMCIDSPAKHAFTFTPSFSFFVECKTKEQIDELFSKLSSDGEIMMPLNNYGFSERFGWTSDKFGVSWQLNLSQ